MKKTLIILIGILSFNFSIGQHLYPEKFDDCKLSKFCLDCGDTKAEPPENFGKEFISGLNKKYLKKINGYIEVQILLDSMGKPCLLSANNKSNITSKKLKLQNGIFQTSNWIAAIEKGKPTQTSVSLKLIFSNGNFNVSRIIFDFSKNTNSKSVGTPVIKGTKSSKLSETWTVYNQQNSDLPWDMTRSVAIDQDNVAWISTDNGIVKIENEKITVYNSENSPIKSKRGKSFTKCLNIDSNNNIWFTDGYNGYKFDREKWTVYDTISTPLRYTTGIESDNEGNVYFRTFKGLRKFNGKDWLIIDKTNTALPKENISGFFIDSKNRTWIGTYGGNICISNGKIINYNDLNTIISKGSISEMYEDKGGNIWFNLYSKERKTGLVKLSTEGNWSIIQKENSKLPNNDILDFAINELENIIWFSINKVGIVKYQVDKDKWEIYTNENSNVPSNYIEQIALDSNGILWAATFAGVIKLNKK